ncbi:hypothetical protein AVEN_5115-1 [Araneus ventricosus]|uniref:Uncharacterized protein n=1 Tax=Araneus ventricosus TaxID=182803 RepID=A0A4Y2WTU9_ARAVE|nr:hypothetical protein AVEN_5115-1 [Araneus ventricosus]
MLAIEEYDTPTVGFLAVHEKQEANRVATASHGELPRLPSRDGLFVCLIVLWHKSHWFGHVERWKGSTKGRRRRGVETRREERSMGWLVV